MAGVDYEGMPEDARLAAHASIERLRPGLSARVKGKLAGRATAGRPDVPAWDYRTYVDQHPGVEISDLIAVRFPVIFHGGEDFTIDSVAEWMHEDPEIPSRPFTLDEMLDMWTRLHDARAVRWNSELRAVEQLLPLKSYVAVLTELLSHLRQ